MNALVFAAGTDWPLDPATGEYTPPYWEDLVWGRGDKRGRIPTALALLASQPGGHLALGPGPETGLPEGTATRLAITKLEAQIQDGGPGLVKDPAWALGMVRAASIFRASNTAQECAQMVDYCLEHRLDTAIIVSSPAHFSRCGNTLAQEVARRDLNIQVVAASSQTDFLSTTVMDTVVVEGVHHPGDPNAGLPKELWTSSLLKRIFRVGREKRRALMEGLSGIIGQLE